VKIAVMASFSAKWDMNVNARHVKSIKGRV
jgi:hypothetical protein